MLQQPYHHDLTVQQPDLPNDREIAIFKAKYRLVKDKLNVITEQLKLVQLEIDEAKKYRLSVKNRNFHLREEIALTKQRKKKRKHARRERQKRKLIVTKLEQAKKVVRSKPEATRVSTVRNNRRSKGNQNHIRRYKPMPKYPDGQYITPVSVGILTIISLGTVDYKNNLFHNDRYIWPVGYCVKRYYNSTVTLDTQVVYTASIEKDSKTNRPLFKIVAEDNPTPIISPSPTGAWTEVMRLANKLKNKGFTNSASGPDYFGFSNPTIAKMIQDLSNVELCKNYKKIEFEPMHPKNIPTRKWNPPSF